MMSDLDFAGAFTLTYDSYANGTADFPRNQIPVTILGESYSTLYDYDKLKRDVLTLPWVTYRRDFKPIGGTGPKCDQGWGCMLRCGQMMLCKAMMNIHLPKGWTWSRDSLQGNATYRRIMDMFLDIKSAGYSIHQISQMGVAEGKAVGQWFGPNTIAHVLKKLSCYDGWNQLVVHVAMDNTIVIEDIKNLCQTKLTSSGVKLKFDSPQLPENASLHSSLTEEKASWRPLLLMVPLRLGLNEINDMYISNIKSFFHIKQSVGVLGGKPNHAHWFIGYTGDELVFLDPHTTQPTVEKDDWGMWDDSSYHCPIAGRMNFRNLDPSIALGFLCQTEVDLDNLCRSLRCKQSTGAPMIEVVEKRPGHLPPVRSGNPHGTNTEFHVVTTDPVYDTDEEYELV